MEDLFSDDLVPWDTEVEQQEFYWKMQDSIDRSEDIGVLKQNRESMMNYARLLIMFGLKSSSPVYTGNLMSSGINDVVNSTTSCDINILAPGLTDKNGNQLPSYGWQTDMLDRLQFYTQDLEFIDVPNKNKGWVDRSVARSVAKICMKLGATYTVEE